MRGDMGDMASPQGRGRQRDRTDVFADESQALDEIAKQVRRNPVFKQMYERDGKKSFSPYKGSM